MNKNPSGLFMVVSILLMALHTMRGQELGFVIEGQWPYILYYGTVGMYVIGLLWYGYPLAKRIYSKVGRKREKY